MILPLCGKVYNFIHPFLCRFIYTNTTELDGETVLKCLNAGKKYCIQGLQVLCTQFLDRSVSVENVCTIYEQARFFQIGDLVSKCKRFIQENELAVIKGNDFRNFHRDSLTDFLAIGKLPNNEIDYFEAAHRWSEEECKRKSLDASPENRREVPGPAFHEIKFGLFTPEEFAKKVKPTGLLTTDEQTEIYPWIILKKQPRSEILKAFSSIPRSIECNTAVKDTCFKESRSLNDTFYISLSVSYPMALTKLETSISGLEARTKSVSVTEEKESQEVTTTTISDMQYNDNTITLNNSAELKPGVTYTISIDLKGEQYYDQYYGYNPYGSEAFQHYVPHNDEVSVPIVFGGLIVSVGEKLDVVQRIGLNRTTHKISAT